MKLSDLTTGQIAIIAKVSGHGGFRKRIVEMGFIKGTKVKVVLNAPLRDPIEYELMGYKISLRRAEAALVEVISENEVKEDLFNKIEDLDAITPSLQDQKEIDLRMQKMAEQKGHNIKIALIGNPNCGKTSLFNVASGSSEHVGNYSGVTVDSRTATFTHVYNKGETDNEKYKIDLVDLPGTYSLSIYSNEEAYVRKLLIEETPDIIINVIDATNLERNLYLTTQLLDFNIRMVIALNMYDEFKVNNDELDIWQLSQLLGTPIIPTTSRTGEGITELINCAICTYEGKSEVARHIHVNHGPSLESGINRIKESLQKNEQIRYKYSTRYLAIKLLEGDTEYNSFNRVKSLFILILMHSSDTEELKENKVGNSVVLKRGGERLIRNQERNAEHSHYASDDEYVVWYSIVLTYVILDKMQRKRERAEHRQKRAVGSGRSIGYNVAELLKES
jgi:ferrous iron transport protein B